MRSPGERRRSGTWTWTPQIQLAHKHSIVPWSQIKGRVKKTMVDAGIDKTFLGTGRVMDDLHRSAELFSCQLKTLHRMTDCQVIIRTRRHYPVASRSVTVGRVSGWQFLKRWSSPSGDLRRAAFEFFRSQVQ